MRPPPSRIAALLAAIALAAPGIGCASGLHARAQPAPEAAAGQQPTEPEELMHALARHWEGQAPHHVAALFAPERQALARREIGQVRARLQTWELVGWHLAPGCHGRGPELLLARLELRPRQALLRADAEPIHLEEMWLRVDDQGRWWLHSL